nr:MAG TPA: hypothetical protein [Caudoviricetes sp.]
MVVVLNFKDKKRVYPFIGYLLGVKVELPSSSNSRVPTL